MKTHCGSPVQWNSLRKPTGLWRSCIPALAISGDSIACGLPSVSAIACSRKRARPSVSVNSVTWVKWAGMAGSSGVGASWASASALILVAGNMMSKHKAASSALGGSSVASWLSSNELGM